MKKLMTADQSIVTFVAIVSLIAPAVFGQGKKLAKVDPSPAKSARQAQIKAGMDPQRLARIPVRMKEFVDGGLVAGAVTLVARHGVVVSLEAVGYQNLETRTPMRTDSIFQIRSMTKPITAVGIMILLEEGRLVLSDPVEKYVPEFRNQMVGLSWNLHGSARQIAGAKRDARDLYCHDLRGDFGVKCALLTFDHSSS